MVAAASSASPPLPKEGYDLPSSAAAAAAAAEADAVASATYSMVSAAAVAEAAMHSEKTGGSKRPLCIVEQLARLFTCGFRVVGSHRVWDEGPRPAGPVGSIFSALF